MIDSKHFKTAVIEKRAKLLHPKVYEIMEEMVSWLLAKGVSPVITETVTTLAEDAMIKRKSVTHRQGRAFDLRTRDWPRPLLREFKDHFNQKYGKLGALGATTMQPNLLLWHDIGHGEHFHVQLNNTYLVNLPKNLDAKEEKA